MMNFLKALIVAAIAGVSLMACTVEENQQCFECTATDPNGQGTPVSDEVCADALTLTQQADFQTAFEAQHNPAMYDINCQLKD